MKIIIKVSIFSLAINFFTAFNGFFIEAVKILSGQGIVNTSLSYSDLIGIEFRLEFTRDRIFDVIVISLLTTVLFLLLLRIIVRRKIPVRRILYGIIFFICWFIAFVITATVQNWIRFGDIRCAIPGACEIGD